MPYFKPITMRGRIDKQGRIVIPAEIRRELGLEPGVTVTLVVEDDALRVMTLRQAIKRVQEIVRRRTKGRSLVDELLAERRAEASREEQT